MKAIVVSFVFCAAAICQSASDNHANQSLLLDKLQPAPSLAEMAQKRLLTMKLKAPELLKRGAIATPKVCAIPLLNALPATSAKDPGISIYRPSATLDPMATYHWDSSM